MSEFEVRKMMQKIAQKNKVFPVVFRGAGAYRHFIPSVVKSVISKEDVYKRQLAPLTADVLDGVNAVSAPAAEEEVVEDVDEHLQGDGKHSAEERLQSYVIKRVEKMLEKYAGKNLKARAKIAWASTLAGMVEARSEEHTSELQSHYSISYAVFCLKRSVIREHS